MRARPPRRPPLPPRRPRAQRAGPRRCGGGAAGGAASPLRPARPEGRPRREAGSWSAGGAARLPPPRARSRRAVRGGRCSCGSCGLFAPRGRARGGRGRGAGRGGSCGPAAGSPWSRGGTRGEAARTHAPPASPSPFPRKAGGGRRPPPAAGPSGLGVPVGTPPSQVGPGPAPGREARAASLTCRPLAPGRGKRVRSRGLAGAEGPRGGHGLSVAARGPARSAEAGETSGPSVPLSGNGPCRLPTTPAVVVAEPPSPRESAGWGRAAAGGTEGWRPGSGPEAGLRGPARDPGGPQTRGRVFRKAVPVPTRV